MKAKSKQNSKAVHKTKKATKPQWHQMNSQQRRDLARTIQSEEISLEVVHSDAASIDIGNDCTTSPCPPVTTKLPLPVEC